MTESKDKPEGAKPDPKEEMLLKLQGYAKPVISFISMSTPIVIMYVEQAYAIYKTLPDDQIQLIWGSILCFFGGMYPVLFAALEAAKHGGLDTAQEALKDLADEAKVVIEASKKDDDKDDDGDGVRDVDALAPKELILRKAHLVITKMNPEKVDKALASIYKVWLAVLAVLSVQFARTIALAVSISKFLNKPMNQYVVPSVQTATPNEYSRWIPVISGWITKSIGMSLAFYLQSIVYAFTSAMTGALIMTRSIMSIAYKKEITFGGLIPADHKETQIDEWGSYALAAMGFMFQWKMNFGIPFPFNLLFLPIELMESFLQWSITK